METLRATQDALPVSLTPKGALWVELSAAFMRRGHLSQAAADDIAWEHLDAIWEAIEATQQKALP